MSSSPPTQQQECAAASSSPSSSSSAPPLPPTEESLAAAKALMKQRNDNRDPDTLASLRKTFNSNKSSLKVDIKKATAFGKKMKTFTADQEKGIMADLQAINVGMFVTEAAQGVGAAVWEGKMKVSDAVAFVDCMSAIHQRYDAFLPDALQGLQQGFAPQMQLLVDECTTKLDMATGAIADAGRFKVAVRVMCELYLQGLIPQPKFFVAIATKFAAAMESKPTAHATINMLSVIVIMLRALGLEMTGLGFRGAAACNLSFNDAGVTSKSIVESSKKVGADATIAKESGFTHIEPIAQKAKEELAAKVAGRRVEPYASAMMAPQADRDEFVKKVTRIAELAAGLCDKLRKEVENKWRQLCEMTELQGEIATEKREAFGAFKRETERFIVLVENIASMLGGTAAEKFTPKPIDLYEALRNSSVDQSVVLVTSSMADFFNVKNAETINHYDSEEQREFYENLFEIEEGAYFPADIVTRPVPKPADGKNKGGASQQAAADDYDDYDDEESAEDPLLKDDEEPVPITILSSSITSVTNGGNEAALNNAVTAAASSTATVAKTEKVIATYDAINAHLALVYNLPSAEAADQWVKTYLTESCKYFAIATNPYGGALLFFNGCRRKLQKVLRNLGRCNHETIPMVARVVATLSRRFDELGDVLSKKVEGELQHAIQKHSPTAFMRKMRSSRYLCELVKFRVAAPISVIKLFQNALKEIDNPHSVEIILILIGNVTSFLLRGGMTRVRAEDYLKQLKEIRVVKGAAIGSGQESMLEQAMSELAETMRADNSASESGGGVRRNQIQIRQRSALEQYFRYLLFSELTEETLEEVCQSIRQMPWALSCEQGLTPPSAAENNGGDGSSSSTAPPAIDAVAATNGERHYDMLIRVFRKTHQCRWDRLHVLAEALADTCDVYPAVGAAVIDVMLEDIRTDLTVASAAHHKALRALAVESIKLKAIQQLAEAAATNNTTAAAGAAAALAAANDGGDNGSAGAASSNSNAKASSSLARHLAKSLEPSRSASGLYTQVAARSNQKLLVDLKFIAELYNQRIIEFRAVAYVLAQLCCFYPNPEADPSTSSSNGSSSSPPLLSEQQRVRMSNGTGQGAALYNYYVTNTNPVDYSRIRFICGLLDCFIPYVSVGTSNGTTLSASERLSLERFMARFFLLIHSKAKPFPMDLDYKLAETLQRVADVLYPYPEGYEYLGAGERSGGAIKKISDVPEGELAAFQTQLERAAERKVRREYTRIEWRKKSSTQRRELKQEAQKAILKAGDYSLFTKSNVPNPVPWHVIGQLLQDALGRKRHEKDYRDALEKGEEVREAPVLTRAFYFPRSRAEAEAHFDFMLLPVRNAAAGRPAPGVAVLAKVPVVPDLPKGHNLSKSRTKYYDEMRMLALTAIPTAPLTQSAREAYWFEAVCSGLIASATNGGLVYAVIPRGGSGGAKGGAAAALLAADIAAADAQQQELDAAADGSINSSSATSRTTAVEAKGAADGTHRSRRTKEGAASSAAAANATVADEDDDDEDDDRFDSDSDSTDEDDDGGSSSSSSDEEESCSSSSSSDSASSFDDSDEDDRVHSDEEEDDDGRGPSIGPQAFGLKNIGGSTMVGGGSSSSNNTNDNTNNSSNESAANANNANMLMAMGRHAEEAAIDRLMTHMLLESTGKALQRETILDKRLEQRLSSGYYRTAADKVLPQSEKAAKKEAPPPVLIKRGPQPKATTNASAAAAAADAPIAISSERAKALEDASNSASSPATPAPAPTHTPFALIRRSTKGTADARAFMVPTRSEFAQHVDGVIAEVQKGRAMAMKTTFHLSKQQDAERAEEIRQKQLREAAAAMAAAGSGNAPVTITHSKEERVGSYRFGSGARK